MKKWLCIGLTASVLFVSGCVQEKTFEGMSPEKLYSEGYKAFQKTDFEEAAEYFDEVEKQHPYSVWSERAQIMAAYSFYKKNKYDDAVLTLERFIQLHPGNRNTAYAYYLKGLCYFEQISDPAREQSMTQKAQETFKDLMARYPDSIYVADVKSKMGEILNHLAAQEMTIGRYYLKHTDLISAVNRFKKVIEVYPDSNQVPEAYYRLTVSYLMLGMDKAAQKTGKTALKKYPDGVWTIKLKNLLKE